MDSIEKSGSLYLGKIVENSKNKTSDKPFFYEAKNLTTHAVCVGMTGSGKTGLAIAMLEELALSGIPAIAIDPKGDLGNLMLTFPNLSPEEFLPWIDTQEAERESVSPEKYSSEIAKTWKDGLAAWGEDAARIQKLKKNTDISIYTPANKAGIQLSILNSFAAPSKELQEDTGLFRDRVLTTTSSLLGLLGINADPIKSREHILISTILNNAWSNGKDLNLSELIHQIQKPPFDKIGVFDTETFFPQKDRLSLAMSLNNLLASPGFQEWMNGEPLDIQNLLYTKENKPKLAIITIAHLSDSERMFFVTLLLNEILSWMRRQTGTSNLRALLYMDEIFGFFPPTASPPSKLPMITLLKQARAFGLGIVLATQNPVDLDYKGLSNCGTWFIGKLQTERDKARVLEGLNAASNGDLNTTEINKMIAACGKRVFILRSVYLKEPLLFETRWTMSYLRGPLTMPQIQTLMQSKKQNIPSPKADLKANSTDDNEQTNSQKPDVPSGIKEYFATPPGTQTILTYEPKILGVAKLHFVDSKSKIDKWESLIIASKTSPENNGILWEKGEDITSVFDKLGQSPPNNGKFTTLPSSLMQVKNYAQFTKSFAEYLYQNQTYNIYQAPDYKMTSRADESEEDFRNRVSTVFQTKSEQDVKKIQDKYKSKIDALQDKLQRAKNKADVQKSQASRTTMNTWISVGTTILGTLLGKGVSKGTISQAGTSIKKVGNISKEHQDVQRAEDSVGAIESQLQDIQSQMNAEVNALNSKGLPSTMHIDTTSIRPRKSDISVESIAILWCPLEE